jgi:hypothetical protein
MLVSIYEVTFCHVPEECKLHAYCCQISNFTHCFLCSSSCNTFHKLNLRKESAFEFVTVKENSLLDNPRTSHGKFHNGLLTSHLSSTKTHNTRINSCKDNFAVKLLSNFPCYKLSSHFINRSNRRHRLLFSFCQFWMPNIDYKHESGSRPVVPYLMLKTVIKYKQLSLFPGPKKILRKPY